MTTRSAPVRLTAPFDLAQASELISAHQMVPGLRTEVGGHAEYSCLAGCVVKVPRPFNINATTRFAAHQAEILIGAGLEWVDTGDFGPVDAVELAARTLWSHRWDGDPAFVGLDDDWFSQWCGQNCKIRVLADELPRPDQQVAHQCEVLARVGFNIETPAVAVAA